MAQDPSEGKDEEDDDGGKNASGYPNMEKVLMIFADIKTKTKSRLNVINREVNMALPTVTKYLN